MTRLRTLRFTAPIACTLMIYLTGCAHTGSSGTQQNPPNPAAAIAACKLLDTELSSLDKKFKDANAKVIAGIRSSAAEPLDNASRAEVLRYAAAVARYHDIYIQLSLRRNDMLLKETTK
jgi:hypothetical protein